jgi:hypothetical protein
MVTVTGATRMVAALVDPGRTSYTILLGRHWMYTVKVRGVYEHNVSSKVARVLPSSLSD